MHNDELKGSKNNNKHTILYLSKFLNSMVVSCLAVQIIYCFGPFSWSGNKSNTTPSGKGSKNCCTFLLTEWGLPCEQNNGGGAAAAAGLIN